jgi:hypothetical protein
MAIRIIYSLLVNDERISCCQHRRDDLERESGSFIQMGYMEQQVNIYDLAKCDSCQINPCLFKPGGKEWERNCSS